MRTYLATYHIEFLSPKSPREWPLEAFERAIDHLLADEILARREAKEDLRGVAIASTDGVDFEDGRKPLSRIYRLHHDAVVPGDDPALLQAALSDLLGVTPRQFEGPWNIVSIEVTLTKKRPK